MRNEDKSKDFKNHSLTLQNMCKNYSFLKFLTITHKYREFKSIESIVCAVVSVVYLWVMNNYSQKEVFIQQVYSMYSLIIPAYIGMIGFLFAGLALMASIISKEALKKINDEGNILQLSGILFSFYFCGALIIFAIFSAVIFYLYTSLNLEINIFRRECLLWAIVLINIYFITYALLYAVSLLGSCIKLYFLNIYKSK